MDKEKHQYLTLVHEALKFYYEILCDDPTGEILSIIDNKSLEALQEEYRKIVEAFKISIERLEQENN